MKLLILSCCVIAAFAAPQGGFYNQPKYYPNQYQNQYNYQQRPFVPIVSENNEINPDGSYRYSYQTGDGQQANAQGYLKNAGSQQEATVAQGSYSYTAPDGTPITVNWVADEFGFRAEGAHLPTPPPIPAAIQKSLALTAGGTYQGQQGQQGQYFPQRKYY